MSKVSTILTYRIDATGETFPTIEKLIDGFESKIEKFFKPHMMEVISYRNQLAFIEHIIRNRHVLAELLSYPSREEIESEFTVND